MWDQCSQSRSTDTSTCRHCPLTEVLVLHCQTVKKQVSHLLQRKNHQEDAHHFCWSYCLVQAQVQMRAQGHQTRIQKTLLGFCPWVLSQMEHCQTVKKQVSRLLQQKSHQEEAHHFCWSSCLVQAQMQAHQTRMKMQALLVLCQTRTQKTLLVLHQMKNLKSVSFVPPCLVCLSHSGWVW